MKLIDPSYEIIEQQDGLEGLYKHIELCGRTCYKSEDKITETSAEAFVQRMIDSGHTAMLEHGTCYLYFKHDERNGVDMGDPYDISLNLMLDRFTTHNSNFDTHETFFTTNLRVLIEHFPNDWKGILEHHMVPYDERFTRRTTVKFTCNRQVSHEFVRHRVFSFAQESTRYCNYTKDKFGNELIFIKPCWKCTFKDNMGFIYRHPFYQTDCLFQDIEDTYNDLIAEGWKPQEAATILPNALKTTLMMTGTVDQWDKFFDLRARGTTGAPHPQAKQLAEPLMNEFITRNWIKNGNAEINKE